MSISERFDDPTKAQDILQRRSWLERAIRRRRCGPDEFRTALLGFESKYPDVEIRTSLLHFAARSSSEDCVRVLAELGTNLDEYDGNKNTALHIASTNLSIAVVQTLVKFGADLYMGNDDGETALITAVKGGFVDIVNLLLEASAENEEKLVDLVDDRGRSALWWAAEYGDEECIQILVGAGANCNKCDSWGYFPLHRAAKGASVDSVSVLLAYGANANVVDEVNQDSPLCIAVRTGNLGIISELIKMGASANGVSGEAIVAEAVSINRTTVVLQLALKGADIDKTNKYFQSPVDIAAKNAFRCSFVALYTIGADMNHVEALYKAPGNIGTFFDDFFKSMRIYMKKNGLCFSKVKSNSSIAEIAARRRAFQIFSLIRFIEFVAKYRVVFIGGRVEPKKVLSSLALQSVSELFSPDRAEFHEKLVTCLGDFDSDQYITSFTSIQRLRLMRWVLGDMTWEGIQNHEKTIFDRVHSLKLLCNKEVLQDLINLRMVCKATYYSKTFPNSFSRNIELPVGLIESFVGGKSAKDLSMSTLLYALSLLNEPI